MPEPTITFSIIIPTRGRPIELARCLDALTRLDYSPEAMEVIVVDDGSPIALDHVVEPFRERMTVRLLRQDRRGPAAARNAGANVAQGEFVAFTDDDCQVAQNWLRALEQGLRADSNRMIGGRVQNGVVGNRQAVASQVILDMVYAFYNCDPEAATFFASNNVAMPARLYRKIGGFDVQFPRAAAEDRDLCDRWRHAGYQLAYAPDAVVFHYHNLTLQGYVRQHFNYGCGASLYHARRQQRGTGRLRNDFPFHLQLPRLLRCPMSKLRIGKRVEVIALLAVWQLANAAGFFWQRFAKPDRSTMSHLHEEVDAIEAQSKMDDAIGVPSETTS